MVGDSEVTDISGAYNIGMDSALISMSANKETKANFQVSISRLFDYSMAITKINMPLKNQTIENVLV